MQGARLPTDLVSRGSLHLGLMSAGLRGWWGSARGVTLAWAPWGIPVHAQGFITLAADQGRAEPVEVCVPRDTEEVPDLP